MRNPSAPDPRDPIPNGAPVSQSDERRVGLTPITLFVVLLLAYVMIQVQLVLILTLLALVFATVIERPVQLLEARRVPRGVAILAVYAGIIGSLVLLGFALAPSINSEAATFREEIPDQLRELRSDWRGSDNPILDGPGAQFLSTGINLIEGNEEPDQQATLTAVTSVGGGIVGLLALLAIAFYYLMEKPLLRRLVLTEVSPAARPRVTRIWDNVEAKVGGWIRGQLTLCLIIGVSATIGYGLLDIKFWPLLGLWAGITEIIPIIGPWLGGIPAVAVALTLSPEKALLVVGFILLLQFMENTVLVPRVMRGTVGLTPLTVFVAVLAGTEFIGPAGAILAIPIAALIQVLITDYLDTRRGANSGAPQIPTWRWMRGQFAGGLGATTGRGTAGGSVLVPRGPAPTAAELGGTRHRADGGGATTAQAPAPTPQGEVSDDTDGAPQAGQDEQPEAPAGEPAGRTGWTSDLLNRVPGRHPTVPSATAGPGSPPAPPSDGESGRS